MDKVKAFAKKLGIWAIIGLALVIGIKMIVPGKKDESSKGGNYAPPTRAQEVNFPMPKAEAAKQFPRKYRKVYNISRTTEPHFVLEVEIPAGEEWVSVALPPWYRVVSSHDVWVEYDKGLPGRETIKEPPGQSPEDGNIPMAFDARGMGKAGKLIIRGYRQTPEPQAPKKEAKKVSSKKVRPAHKDRQDADVPHSVQIM